MAASCISVSLGAAASSVLGRSVQVIGSRQSVRQSLAAHCAERKFAFVCGLESLASRTARNAGIIARAVELDENKDGILFSADSESDNDSAAVEESPAPAAPNTKLYVGNLPWSVDSKQLAEVFEEHGNVELVEVIYDRDTQRSRGFAFVTMRTTEDAEKIIEKLDGSELGGRVLKVNFPQTPKEPRSFRNDRPPRERREGEGYVSRPARTDNANKLFIGNLGWTVDDVALTQLISEYGQVLEAKVIHDRETGRSRGFAYATMSNVTEVETAIQALDGVEHGGRVLRVNRASDRPERKARTFQQ